MFTSSFMVQSVLFWKDAIFSLYQTNSGIYIVRPREMQSIELTSSPLSCSFCYSWNKTSWPAFWNSLLELSHWGNHLFLSLIWWLNPPCSVIHFHIYSTTPPPTPVTRAQWPLYWPSGQRVWLPSIRSQVRLSAFPPLIYFLSVLTLERDPLSVVRTVE